MTELFHQVRKYIGASTETKPTAASNNCTTGSTFYEYDTGKMYITYDGTNWAIKNLLAGSFLTTKTSTSPLTTGTLFNFYGSVAILNITGLITTIIENAVTNVKLSIRPDAQTAVDICANLSVQLFAAGSLLSITGTAANAMVGTTAVAVNAPTIQLNPIIAACVTSGIITVTYGAASTGAIRWDVEWKPLNAAGRIVAA